MDSLRIRSEGVQATTGEQSVLGAIGAKPPEEWTRSRSDDIEAAIGATAPEEQAAHEIRDARISNNTKQTTPQQISSRRRKQSQRAFLDMCRAAPDNLLYHAVQQHDEILTAETSQDIRHVARINIKGRRYQQLLLTNSQLFKVFRKNAAPAMNSKQNLNTSIKLSSASMSWQPIPEIHMQASAF